MSAVKGRRKNRDVVAQIRGRVTEAQHAKLQRMAELEGLSLAATLERVIAHQPVDHNGRPLWHDTHPCDKQPEAPMSP